MLEPVLKGPAAFDYLGKAFIKRYGPPSDAITALPLTMQWLLPVRGNMDQEWNEHKNALSELRRQGTSSQTFIPNTTLRTGGSFAVKTMGNPTSVSPSTPMDLIGKFNSYPLKIAHPHLFSCFSNLTMTIESSSCLQNAMEIKLIYV